MNYIEAYLKVGVLTRAKVMGFFSQRDMLSQFVLINLIPSVLDYIILSSASLFGIEDVQVVF